MGNPYRKPQRWAISNITTLLRSWERRQPAKYLGAAFQ